MSDDFSAFFQKFNLSDLKPVFLENDFRNIEGLMEVTNEDLIDMGITKLGLRKSFLGALTKVKEGKNATETTSTKLHVENSPTTPDTLEISDPSNDQKQKSSSSAATDVGKITHASYSDERQMSMQKETKSTDYFTPSRQKELTKKRLFSSVASSNTNVEQKLITEMMSNSSPCPEARRKGVRIYSPLEIQKAKGYEKLRLAFCNEIAEKAAADGLSKTEISGVCDFEWRLRKSLLIRDNADGLSSPSVSKNIERMESDTRKVRECARLVSKARDENKHVLADNLEKIELFKHFSELKKSQDAAIKACKRAEEKLDKSMENADKDLEELEEEEINECIQEVKRKKHEFNFQ